MPEMSNPLSQEQVTASVYMWKNGQIKVVSTVNNYRTPHTSDLILNGDTVLFSKGSKGFPIAMVTKDHDIKPLRTEICICEKLKIPLSALKNAISIRDNILDGDFLSFHYYIGGGTGEVYAQSPLPYPLNLSIKEDAPTKIYSNFGKKEKSVGSTDQNGKIELSTHFIKKIKKEHTELLLAIFENALTVKNEMQARGLKMEHSELTHIGTCFTKQDSYIRTTTSVADQKVYFTQHKANGASEAYAELRLLPNGDLTLYDGKFGENGFVADKKVNGMAVGKVKKSGEIQFSKKYEFSKNHPSMTRGLSRLIASNKLIHMARPKTNTKKQKSKAVTSQPE